MQKRRAKRPKATAEPKQKAESRKQKGGVRPPKARYKPSAWEEIGRYMRGTCMVQARYRPPRGEGRMENGECRKAAQRRLKLHQGRCVEPD